ncbi:MAG TPA: hypothetical protein VGR24_06820 [bacterium]|nr:hypothetical protein [bacterium]
MPRRVALVATTIGTGEFIARYAQQAAAEDLTDEVVCVVVTDRKTPPEIRVQVERAQQTGLRVVCPSLPEQDAYLRRLGEIARIIPYDSDNRRNVGFLLALEQQCDLIISIDDDNLPRPGERFFGEHMVVGEEVTLRSVRSGSGWFNVCRLLETEPAGIYPRGFPYRHRHAEAELSGGFERGSVHVNAGLWLRDPDVDAVTHLALAPQVRAFRGESVLLGPDTWSPINTQNTAIVAAAVPAFYFVRMGAPILGVPMDRDGDIFTGYFLQACARHLGARVRVGTPVTDHVRNAHHPLRDLTQELACIWMLEELADWLKEVPLEGSGYAECYLSLASRLEDAVEQFSGFIWTDPARAYFHFLAYCMRTWVKTVALLT